MLGDISAFILAKRLRGFLIALKRLNRLIPAHVRRPQHADSEFALSARRHKMRLGQAVYGHANRITEERFLAFW